MEELLIGGEWLDDLLKETKGTAEARKQIRDGVKALSDEEKGALRKRWEAVNQLLKGGEIGEAHKEAAASFAHVRERLEGLGEAKRAILERPLCPFLISRREITRVLNPPEEIEALYHPRDDLEKLLSLEMINATRRLLASWGAEVIGGRAQELVSRLEKELEELRESEASFLGEDHWDDLEGEEGLELVDRLASLATRFAHDLLDLHLLNAANLEVRLRFDLLWRTVRQLREDDILAAAFEAQQVLEEALGLAGLRSGELLDRVDLIYERFSDAEGLRRAVNRLVVVSRDGDEVLQASEGSTYISNIAVALKDLGLPVS